MMCALQDVAAQDQVRVRFVCVPDEESEDVDDRSTDVARQATGLHADFAITGEPTDLHIGVQAKGVLALRLEVSRHRRARLDAVARRQRDPQGARRLPPHRDAAVQPRVLRPLRPPVDQPRADHRRRRLQQGPRPSARMDVDIRFLPSQDPDEILTQIRAIGGPRDRQAPSSARRRSSRATTRTCWRCATRSAARSRARRCRSGATARPTRSRSSRRASRRSSSARSAAATTAPHEWVSISSLARYRRALGDFVKLLPALARAPGAAVAARRRRRRWRSARRRPLTYPLPRAPYRVRRSPTNKPPRVALGMYKRFALAGVLITLLTAATVASAALLEVKELVSIMRDESAGHVIPGVKNALDDVPAGKPQTILVLGSDRRFVDIKQDNPARSDTMMLVRLDPQGGHRGDVDPARPQGADPLRAAASTRRRSTPPTRYGGPALTVKTVAQPAAHPDQPRRQRELRRLPARRQPPGLRLRRRRPALLPLQRRACRSARSTRRSTSSRLPEALRLEVPGLRALPPRRRDFVRAARQQDFLRQAKDQFGLGRLFGDRKELLRIFARYTRHRPALDSADPAAAQARLRGLEAPDPRGALPRRHRAGVRDHLAHQPRAHQAGVPARQGLERIAPARPRGAQAAEQEGQAPLGPHLARAAARRHRRQDGRRERTSRRPRRA